MRSRGVLSLDSRGSNPGAGNAGGLHADVPFSVGDRSVKDFVSV